MQYASFLLSKVIDDNDPAALSRFNVAESEMPTAAERAAYRLIVDYAAKNRGQAPSYATVVAEVPEFLYAPDVSDSYEFLARQVKDHAGRLEFSRMFEPGAQGQSLIDRKFAELSGENFLEWLQSELETIKMRTSVRDKVGTNVKADNAKFRAEYERRKAGESFRIWRSKFSSIGEYVSGNLYTVFGKSGRGKSVITLEDAIYAAKQGANVLIWAMEMGWFEVLVRIYVSISGEAGVTQAQTHGMDLAAGFSARDVRLGQLSADFEAAFHDFVATLNDRIDGNITVRAVDDADFTDRSLRALEVDIYTTKADYVVVDPFYYMDFERNTSNTTGGDATNTSNELRRLAGNTSTAIIAITQAEEGKENFADENGERTLALPERKDVKKTKGLLEDAAVLIGVDSDYKQGRGLVGVIKGRDGGEGDLSEILYIPSVGVVREMPSGEAAASQFVGVF